MSIRLYMGLLGAGLSYFVAQAVYAQALPGYIPPVNKVGGAVAEGIAQTLIRRGFAANDPRILQTVNAVGARVVPLATAAGAGATWASTIARLSPWVTAGVFVYQGVTWWFDSQGKAYLAPPGSTSGLPLYSNGVFAGSKVYSQSNNPSFLAGSVEEAYSKMVSNSIAQNADAKFGVPTIKQTDSTTWSVQYNYSIPSLYLNNMSYTATTTSSIYNGPLTCAAGSGVQNGECVGAGLSASPFANAPVVGYDIPTAYNNLPSPAKASNLSPELAAEITNRLWKDAASQPEYPGVPWSATSPVTAPDLAPYQTAHPGDWPKTLDIATPVPVTGPNAVTLPDSNPNQTTSPTTATKVDLGADPGTPSPTLEDVPTDLFKPISDLMRPWLTWTVPAHDEQCPKWQASPSISGHVFAIDFSYHCTFAEQYRAAISGAAMACWVLIAAFIVLSA